MKVAIAFLGVLFALTACAAQAPVDDGITCSSPYIRFADACCLDANANTICDDDERTSPSMNNTGQEAEIIVQKPQLKIPDGYELPPLKVSFVDAVPPSPDELNYLARFREKTTLLVIGTGDHEAPLVAAGTNIMTYYSFADHITYAFGNDADASTALGEKNVIALGNACNNQVISDMLGNPEDCLEGTPAKNQGIIRMWSLDGHEVLVILARDPVIVHAITNLLIHDQIDYRGNELELEFTNA